MSLNVRPIVSALLRNRTGALLVALQIAIALAVLANAVFIVMQRVEKIGSPTGLDIENTFVVSSSGFGSGFQSVPSIREDLDYLRHLDGVVAATPVNSVPLGGSCNQRPVSAKPDDRQISRSGNLFEVDEQGVDTLGVQLVAGRAFRRDEILPPITKENASAWVPQIIVTRAYARYLFPDGSDALGKTVYDPLGHSATIIGVMANMHGSCGNVSGGLGHADYVFLAPRLPFTFNGSVYYLVRVKPGQRDALITVAERHLGISNPNRVIDWVRSLQSFKDRTFRDDRNMGIFLVTVTGLLLAITSLGIFGLATFNVSVRTKQIGTRRAVGARRVDIVRYFMVENALITTAGIVVGCAFALGVGYWLSLQYQLPRLDLYYLVGGLLALWAIGQLAVWQPARKASAISPSVATRTV
jgi:putative ABC transport system permease protein